MSKELQALEQSKEIIRKHCENQNKPCYLMLDLEKPFNEIETELKALEIIKKIVVIAELPNLLKTLYDYGKLTEEECELLKEILK